MAAVAYVRRSASEESKVSREAQLETVHRLAAQYGDTIEHVYTDWGRSGGDESRPEYMAMLARAETDGITAIYAYDQDRLARDIWLFSGLLRVADRRGFRVITPAGDLTDEDRRTFAEMRGVMDGGELRKIRKRNRQTAAMQRERGDDLGMAPYGYTFRRDDTGRLIHERDAAKIDHVLDVYRREGTYLAAAAALNKEGWPPRHAGINPATGEPRKWHATTVQHVVAREAPKLAKAVTRGRRREHRPRLFASLMRCYCGGPMSPGTGGGADGYYCGRGNRERGDHPRPRYIAESKLMPWVRAEAARLVAPDAVVVAGGGYDDSAERATLEGLRGKVADAVIDAGIADLDARRAEAGERALRVVTVPPAIDWERWDEAHINRVLGAMWEYVKLGPDLLPVEAVWRVREWRA